MADETQGSSVEGAGDSIQWSRARFSFSRLRPARRIRIGGAVYTSLVHGQFAEELAELHDGSISLFVTLPVFRSLMLSESLAASLYKFEAVIGEHLAYLDGILGDVLVRRDRADGSLTRTLFRSLVQLRQRPASTSRDAEIAGIVEQAQLFLMGSCSFALRYARQAGVDRSVQVLEGSMSRIGTFAVQLVSPNGEHDTAPSWSDAVA